MVSGTKQEHNEYLCKDGRETKIHLQSIPVNILVNIRLYYLCIFKQHIQIGSYYSHTQYIHTFPMCVIDTCSAACVHRRFIMCVHNVHIPARVHMHHIYIYNYILSTGLHCAVPQSLPLCYQKHSSVSVLYTQTGSNRSLCFRICFFPHHALDIFPRL